MGNFFGSSTTDSNNTAQVAKPKSSESASKNLIYDDEESRSQTKSKIDIEEDCNDVKTAVLSAKKGEWKKVWDILGSPDNPRKGYLINCIPETRRWGILHQAVYWRNTTVIQKLLKFKGCDINLRVKVGMSETGDACGKTALELANERGYDDIQDILKSGHACGGYELDTYVLSNNRIIVSEHPLLRITLALYRDAFLSPTKEIKSDQSFHDLLHDIFVDLETSAKRWERVKQIICDSLKPVSKTSAVMISVASTKAEFYGSIIKAYTVEENCLYAYINRALRAESLTDYTPPADDLACGPYTLMFYILMMFWSEMAPEFQTTYRRMKISESDFQMYKPGTKFIWTAFTSSALNENFARSFPFCPADVEGRNRDNHVGVVFIIDNSRSTPWNPRNIESFAAYNKAERTYPPGAMFEVTNIQHERTQQQEYKINLKLVDI